MGALSKFGSKGAETLQFFRKTSRRFDCKCTVVRLAPCSLSLDAGHIAQEELFLRCGEAYSRIRFARHTMMLHCRRP